MGKLNLTLRGVCAVKFVLQCSIPGCKEIKSFFFFFFLWKSSSVYLCSWMYHNVCESVSECMGTNYGLHYSASIKQHNIDTVMQSSSTLKYIESKFLEVVSLRSVQSCFSAITSWQKLSCLILWGTTTKNWHRFYFFISCVIEQFWSCQSCYTIFAPAIADSSFRFRWNRPFFFTQSTYQSFFLVIFTLECDKKCHVRREGKRKKDGGRIAWIVF